MKFDIKKFFSGFNIFNGEKLGKIIYCGVLIAIGGFILWSAFIKPTTKDIQSLNQRLKLENSHIDNLTISTDKKTEPKTKFSLLSIRVLAKD